MNVLRILKAVYISTSASEAAPPSLDSCGCPANAKASLFSIPSFPVQIVDGGRHYHHLKLQLAAGTFPSEPIVVMMTGSVSRR